MNYGKFFRLNWENSHLESGVAVFDYTALTAHDESSDRYPMSPKYPISLAFSSTSVKFLLHYSAFRATKADVNSPQYDFEVSGIGTSKSKEVSIAHMEEVIIELPVAGKGSENLSSVIKRLYESEFPLKTKYGNKFLVQRLEETEEEAKKYRSHAYSSLKCMGSEGEWKPLSLHDTKEQYTGFLRKLMLDFMFDLKHSDVFQNSGYFQAMYTGLMSNFYFSALLHKCEFYFYRQLLWDERLDQATKKKHPQKVKEKIDKRKQGDNREFIYLDYKKEAERLWVKDITSPQAELEFNYDSKKTEWFSNPETEMHEVCFPSQEKNGAKKLCRSMGPEREHRESISQWLMNRYDFKDVYQFHAPAWISWIPVNVMLLSIGLLLMLGILLPDISFIPIRIPISVPVHVTIIIAIFTSLAIFYKGAIKWTKISNHLHLFFPRLMAAIATAWMTLALGFDLMVSFFDATISVGVLIFIVVFLYFFVLAKINQVTPRLGLKKTIWRSVELIVIGYCISFAIGIVMVNFLGERFMERGGYIQDFYAQLEDNKNLEYKGNLDLTLFDGKDTWKEKEISPYQMSQELEHVYRVKKNYDYPIAKRIRIPSDIATRINIPYDNLPEIDVYYLRDFTVIFSFIALFVGIFIELIILGDRRQMTEL